MGLSTTHVHHLFRRWCGLTPKAFLQAITLDNAKALLAYSASVLDATYEVGLSGPGRLHDLFVTHEAMTPGDYKAGGARSDVCGSASIPRPSGRRSWSRPTAASRASASSTTATGKRRLPTCAAAGRRAEYREDAAATAAARPPGLRTWISGSADSRCGSS